MIKYRNACYLCIIIYFISISLTALSVSSDKVIYYINVTPDSLTYKLPSVNLVIYSETVESNRGRLIRNIDYNIDYKQGYITFFSDSTLSDVVNINYFVLPDFLGSRYYLYEKQNLVDSLQSIVEPRSTQYVWSTENLIVKGSKTISLSFSNQQDYSLNQSLFLNLQGELSENLRIEGRLSDSESPLTPEGDTRELSSLDQIYLKLYGNQYSVIFGDQDYSFGQTDLMKYKTRFEGLNLIYKRKLLLQGAFAVNNGKAKTNIIEGIDGKQGPYYLMSGTSGSSISVVPGSERISLNGIYLDRGSDYTIDYQEGSLTFKIMITSNSRIIAEFQYSDDYYAQSTYLSSSAISLAPALELRHHLIHQSDNKNNPLLWTFSAADKDSLQQAGDRGVWGQGIFQVDQGNGSYIQKTDPDGFIYYEYAPADSTAEFLIYFSYVGFGHGDYEIFGNNKFRYVGRNLGSYLPRKSLVPPESKTNLGLNLAYNKNNLKAGFEGVFTNRDHNTFSDLDDSDNSSLIALAKLEYLPTEAKFSPMVGLSYLKRLQNSFSFSDYTTAKEYYELPYQSNLDSLSQDVVDLYIKLSAQESWENKISARYKNVRNTFEQKYINLESGITQTSYTPALKWYAMFSRQAYRDTTQLDYDVQYHSAEASFRNGNLTLDSAFNYKLEDYSGQSTSGNVNIPDTRYIKLKPGITLSDKSKYGFSLSYTHETNARKEDQDWLNSKSASTWQATHFLNSHSNTLNLNYSHREVDNSALLTSVIASEDTRFDLMELSSSHQLWDNSLSLMSSYNLNKLEFYPKIRELEYVGDGLGMYDSTGVLTENGDYEFYLITGKQGKLSTDINAGVNLFFHLSPKYLPKSIIHRFRLDSNFQAANNTTDTNSMALYLILPSDYFSSDSTLYGKKYMQHTLWIDLLKKIVNGKVRYEYSDVLDNRYQDLSRISMRETELELDWKNLTGYRLKTTYLNTLDKDSRYNSRIITDQAEFELFRTFSTALNAQINLNFTREEGNSTVDDDPYYINILKVSPGFNWFLKKSYRLNGTLLLQNNKRSGSDYLSAFPEKRNGLLFNLTTQLQYRFNSFTSGLLQYTGKSYSREEFQHELRMEFRAEL